MAIFASRNSKATEDMEAMIQEFSVQDWAEHEQFVQMFHAAKQRKRVRFAPTSRSSTSPQIAERLWLFSKSDAFYHPPPPAPFHPADDAIAQK